MLKLPDDASILDIQYGKDPMLDAMLLHFMTENNLEYTIDPMKNASAEQLRFVVSVAKNSFFAPCSDWMFLQLLKPGLPRELLREYLIRWKAIMRLARAHVTDRYERRKILGLCRHKFRLALSSPIMLPSRLMKRMLTILLSQSRIDDPCRAQKRELNHRAAELLSGPFVDSMVNFCPVDRFDCTRIEDLRRELDMLELYRMLALSTLPELWDKLPPGEDKKLMKTELAEGQEYVETIGKVMKNAEARMTILYMPSNSGSVLFDILAAKALVRQGHKVIMALKEGFYFTAPTFWDQEQDPELAEAFAGANARFLPEDRLSKNDLLKALRENSFVVISDGTRERFNPFRLSVSMSRAWKESDLVIAKGYFNYRRLMMTTHDYTRDILCVFRDPDNALRVDFRPKAKGSVKFGERYISAQAEAIINEMRQAKARGQTVMFFSGIIGSIPGQTQKAIQIINALVKDLRHRLDEVYIINPGEHFEEGMDADDLMFMWEKVQRSGYIDVWRFQTTEDIERGFELLSERVPPVWAGKDSTYSTGCTKEMHIALDVQRSHPELQIIGPSPDKFFRRREYGVGKFCDVAIDSCD